MMEVLDYARSFVTFTTPGRGNNARLQVESVCDLTERRTGATTRYLFFASCKSEHTFAARDLFQTENYDFCGIFSTVEYAIFRAHATHSPGFREQGTWAGRFEAVRESLRRVRARRLERTDEVVQASLADVPMVGRVEIESPDGTWAAELEFPIKTMNANDIQTMYQVDTGPVSYPDFGQRAERQIERLWPAYVAYNAPDSADFVIQQATSVGSGAEALSVTHYSRIVSLPARTWVLALE
jgi:hypothetical protein